MLFLEDMSLSSLNPCLVYLQNFSEFFLEIPVPIFTLRQRVHYPFIITKQEDISCGDRITRGKKKEMQSELC